MTKLLISVKNVEEAKLALQAGADFIDLKDPTVGALGNLDDELSSEIIKSINKKALVSATVGENHSVQTALLEAIDKKVDIDVDIVKLALSKFFDDELFLQALKNRICSKNIKLVAVMFADEEVDFNWISKLAKLGFYGVMLDTNNKSKNLLCSMSVEKIQSFVKNCEINGLQSGLAGSLRVEYIGDLTVYSPSYLGFRSGVCLNQQRESILQLELVKSVKNQLYKHNKSGVEVTA
jgi:(5-formylfuran-3-yl)methyl phosphate synthase